MVLLMAVEFGRGCSALVPCLGGGAMTVTFFPVQVLKEEQEVKGPLRLGAWESGASLQPAQPLPFQKELQEPKDQNCYIFPPETVGTLVGLASFNNHIN